MRLSLLAAGLFALLVLAGCGGSADADLGAQIEPRDVRLVSEDGGVPFLTGTLVNVTGTAIPSVQVQVGLYDAQNAKVDEMIFPVRDLAPGEEVRFREAVNSSTPFTSVRITGILRL